MTAAYAARTPSFRFDSHRTFDVSLMLAALLHLAGFLLFPGYAPEPLVIEPEEPIIVSNIVEEPILPLPPVPIERPPLPISAELSEVIVSDQVDPMETIIDTEVDIESPPIARIGYAGEASSGERFEPYSTPPMEKKIYKPEYPRLARQAGIEGTVVARVTIHEGGRVTAVEILEAPGEIFHRPVIDALMKSEFYPALQREIPVRSRVIVPFDFYLR